MSVLAVQPSVQLRHNQQFYPLYDGTYLVLLVGALTLMWTVGWQGLAQNFDWWMLWSLPLAANVVILCNVFIHNCTHGNFPRTINRLVGEVCGMVVLSRYASWEIVHRRHHKYSDDVEKDPHPVHPNFWKFGWRTLSRVEQQLQQQFFDLHGDTPENRRHELYRAYLSFSTSVLLMLAWYFFLGPHIFVAMFVPCFVVGMLHLLHFNWITHNATDPGGDYKPVNLDSGKYWLLNRIWFGIYYHANHHKRANLFDPRHMDRVLAAKRGEDSPD